MRKCLLFFLCLEIGLCAAAGVLGQDRTVPTAGIGILEAVRSTLLSHPMLKYQLKQVEIQQAIKQQASSAFDTQLQWSAVQSRTNNPMTDSERLLALQSGVDTNNLATDLTSVSGAAQRLLRSGISIGPRLEMNRFTDSVQSSDGVSRTRLSFDVTVPLWRGKGRDIVASRETSAVFGLEASRYDLNQSVAEAILTTAASYWQYVSMTKQLEIIDASEQRGRELVESVQTLIRADKLPSSEINQVQANLAGRSAIRISMEQQVVEARSALALAMGLGAGEMIGLPAPSDPFPDGEQRSIRQPTPDSIRSLVEEALGRRADYLAAAKRIEAADVSRKSVRNTLLPQLDLTMSTGYAGLQPGRRPDQFLTSPFAHAHGADLLFGFRYSFPSANNLARGRVAEAEAAYEQTQLLRSEKERTIGNGIANALMSVYNSNQRLKKAREAVTDYEAALEGEKDKLRLGVGSLTDLLTVESRLTDTLLELISARQAYAVALVRYRYASGTLIAPDGTVQSVDREVFFEPPR